MPVVNSTTAQPMSSVSKGGQTWTLALDTYSSAQSLYLYSSVATTANGYIARIDVDGSYTPLGGGTIGTGGTVYTGSSMNLTGNATIGGSVIASSAQISGNTTISPAGTGSNYGSSGSFDLQSWSSGLHNWTISSDTNQNINFAYDASNKVQVSSTGVMSAGTISGLAAYLQLQGGASNGGVVFYDSTGVTVNATFPNAGGINLARGSVVMGSSTYGPTSANINGSLSAQSTTLSSLSTNSATVNGSLTATTAGFSGTITSTVNSGVVLTNSSGGVNQLYNQFTSTGANFVWAIDNSAGTALLSGGGGQAYAGTMYTVNATPLVLGTNGTARLTIASGGGATFTSGVAVGGALTGATTGNFSNTLTVNGGTFNGYTLLGQYSAGNVLSLNANSSTANTGAVYINYNNGLYNNQGLRVYDGGSTSFAQFGPVGANLNNGALTGATTGAFSNTLTLSGGGVAINLTNATSNTIQFASNGYAPPAFTTRSVGTREVYWSSLSGTATEYAVGIDGSTLWWSVPNTTATFRWYGATTSMMSLSSGNLATTGSIAGSFGTLSSTSSTTVLYPGGTNTSGFNITNAANTAYNFTLSDAGAGSFRAGLTIAAGLGIDGTAPNASGGISGGNATNSLNFFSGNSGAVGAAFAFNTNAGYTGPRIASFLNAAATRVASIKTDGTLELSGALTGATTGAFSALLSANGGIAVPLGSATTAASNAGTIGVDSSGFLALRSYNSNGISFANSDGTSVYGKIGGISGPSGGAGATINGGLALGGALTGATTGAFSDTITSTKAGQVFNAASGNTGIHYAQFTNTGGTMLIGLEQATANGLLLGSASYAAIFGTTGARAVQFGTNNNVRVTIDGTTGATTFTSGVTVGGALTGATTGAFANSVTISGTGTALNVPNGDISTARNGTTGALFLGNTGNHYVYFDGSNYNMPNGALYYLTGVNLSSGGTFTTGSSYLGATSAIVNGKTVVGAAAANGTMNATGLDVQGADSFSAGSAGSGAQLTIFSTTAAAIDKGSSITLGGNTGNGAASYPFGSIRAAKQTAAADGLYGGYLDFYTVADNGAAARQLRIDKTGAATHSSTVTATTFIATQSGTLISYSGAAAGTGFYHDASNAAIRTAGSIYFQGANGTGTANIAQVGSIAMSGALTGATTGAFSGQIASSVALGSAVWQQVSSGSGSVTRFSAGASTVAGIAGGLFLLSDASAYYLSLSTSGDMGVAGSYYAVSKRASKENIRPISFDSVEAIKNVNIYHYRYKTDQEDANERLGFIADEVPSELSDGKSHDLVHINAVLLDAVKKLTLRIEHLEAARA